MYTIRKKNYFFVRKVHCIIIYFLMTMKILYYYFIKYYRIRQNNIGYVKSDAMQKAIYYRVVYEQFNIFV